MSSIRKSDLIKKEKPPSKKDVLFTQKLLDDSFLLGVVSGDLDRVKQAIRLGADFKGKQSSALLFSSEFGKLEVLKYLILLGLDLTNNMEDCLFRSVKNNRLEVVKYLMESLDLDDKDGISKTWFTGLLLNSLMIEKMDIFYYLLSSDKVTDEAKKKNMYTAIVGGRFEEADAILRMFPSAIEQDFRCQYLVEVGKIEALKYLLKCGVDYKDKINSDGILKKILKGGHLEMFRFLYDEGFREKKVELHSAESIRKEVNDFLMSRREKELLNKDMCGFGNKRKSTKL